jgi:hypothetical protein
VKLGFLALNVAVVAYLAGVLYRTKRAPT